MSGSISNLGLGSKGVLSYDVIEQLRAVDDKNQIAPIDRKLESTKTKLADLDILTIMAATLKSATSSLSSELSYLQRESSVSGDSASVKVLAGTSPQDFSIDVIQLAKSNIVESKAFLSETATFTSTADTITINIDGNDYDINVNAGTTLAQLKDEIFDKTDGKVTASILNIGGAEPYRLIMKSTQTGADQNITVTSTGGGTAVTDLAFNNVSMAQDAQFKYNGIDITRATNSFDDLIVGVSVTLNETGISNISIKQNNENIISNLETFISSYNELMDNLKEATKFDSNLGTSGVFQGVSEINGIKSTLNRELLSVDEQGRSLANYGITLNNTGMLELDKSIIEDKLASDSKDVESFFRGMTTHHTTTITGSAVNAGNIDITHGDFSINGSNIVVSLTGTASQNAVALQNAINSANISNIEAVLDNSNSFLILKSFGANDISISGDSAKLASIGLSAGTTSGRSETTVGIFTTLNDRLEEMISGKNSTLSVLEKRLENQQKSLLEERVETSNRLDVRYEIMAKRFAAHDAIINRLNSQFQSLSMMIEASFADKN